PHSAPPPLRGSSTGAARAAGGPACASSRTPPPSGGFLFRGRWRTRMLPSLARCQELSRRNLRQRAGHSCPTLGTVKTALLVLSTVLLVSGCGGSEGGRP